jgi:hypothetical protein
MRSMVHSFSDFQRPPRDLSFWTRRLNGGTWCWRMETALFSSSDLYFNSLFTRHIMSHRVTSSITTRVPTCTFHNFSHQCTAAVLFARSNLTRHLHTKISKSFLLNVASYHLLTPTYPPILIQCPLEHPHPP